MPEEWAPILSWEGIYEVSDQGRVRRIAPRVDWRGNPRTVNSRTGRMIGSATNRLIRPLLKSGYHQVCLTRGGSKTSRWYTVHGLVAAAFLGPRPSARHTVNHKNGDKLDNRLTNLEYATHRTQQLHAHAIGKRGNYSFKKLSDEQALEIYLDHVRSGREWARLLGVTPTLISSIRTGKSYRWATGAARMPETRDWRPCSIECDCRCHFGLVAPPYQT